MCKRSPDPAKRDPVLLRISMGQPCSPILSAAREPRDPQRISASPTFAAGRGGPDRVGESGTTARAGAERKSGGPWREWAAGTGWLGARQG